jgi:hypothetical protein
MQIYKKILHALNEKAKEQSGELTLWLQKEFGLSSEYKVKAKLTLSVRKTRPAKVMINQQGWVFDQAPSPEDWQVVIGVVKKLSVSGKPYQHSKAIWRYMLEELPDLRLHDNTAHVCNATRLNVHFQSNALPYRLVRVEKRGEDALYSLLVARNAAETP